MADERPTEIDLWEAIRAHVGFVFRNVMTTREQAEGSARRVEAAARTDERTRLVQMLRSHVSGKASEHDAGIRHAAALIEKEGGQ